MNALLGVRKKGLLFILSAPAGTGKTTLVKQLTNEFSQVVSSISYTTRLPRIGEVEGKDYLFTTESEFKKKISEGEFLEYVSLYGTYYGTSKKWVETHLEKGLHVFLVIDTQGAQFLKDKIEAIFIFLSPPSLPVLKERLIKRGTETLETLKKRIEQAEIEMNLASAYDYQVVNDELTLAYQVLKSIVIAECHRTDS